MDRFRVLQKDNNDTDRRRRASHSGFEAPKVSESSLQRRRQSLPATFFRPDEDARQLHNSAACVNIIEDMKSIKLVPKNKFGKKAAVQHALDPYLQIKVRSRRNSTVSPLVQNPLHGAPDVPLELKKASSVENLNKIDLDGFKLRKTSSESLLEGIDVKDPEANDMSDEEFEAPPIATC